VRAVLSEQPDVLITIDCPSFNLGVARRVRNIDPTIANIHYVLPSVWAYRPGRAKKMAGFIDHVLAILPFEPAVSRELAGPPCTYVGHLLIERVDLFRPKSGERLAIGDTRQPVLLVLPGSRRSEIRRLLEPFGSTVSRVAEALDRPLEVILPAVEHHLEEIRSGVSKWRIQPKIVVGESEKFRAFRRAHAALAASGTVTLELALAGVPMVVAYRIDLLFQWIRFIVRGDTIVLANLVVGEKVVPEFIDWQSTPTNMAEALGPLLTESPARRRQLDAFKKLDSLMALDGTTPSARAAEIVLDAVERRQRRLVIGT